MNTPQLISSGVGRGAESQPTDPPSPGEGWRSARWPLLVVVLLGGHAVIITVALLLSLAWIPAALTAPAGYEEALAWDDLQAARQRSDQLGWSLELSPTDKNLLNGDRVVEIRLVDRGGQPIRNAEIKLQMYHLSRPGTVFVSEVLPDESGLYTTALPMRREGAYQLKAVAQRGAEQLLVDTEIWSPASIGRLP
ncbi:FixH family protein [Botrimarina hoheduenensis]|uniref:FixH n=1 Tax=Botrimarina hoheduenensis TaxID=2528000 RepID=A0A5C5VRG2_9BACT|nr:FixH family protein [Botrimarina hoheduenensis]TWT40770.1 FixH [Botrimarina hoheduenensis]